MTDEQRRTSERKRALLGARILFNSRASVFDCMIRDLSDTGARFVLGHPIPLPSEFELEIPSRACRRLN